MRPHPQTEFPFRGETPCSVPGPLWTLRSAGHRTDSRSSDIELNVVPTRKPRTPNSDTDDLGNRSVRAQPSRSYTKRTTRLSVDAGHEQSPARHLPGLRFRYRFTARVADTPTHTSGTIRLSRHCVTDGNSAHSRPDTPIVPVGIPAICACIGVFKFFSEIICS